jgi:hypothetical protein
VRKGSKRGGIRALQSMDKTLSVRSRSWLHGSEWAMVRSNRGSVFSSVQVAAPAHVAGPVWPSGALPRWVTCQHMSRLDVPHLPPECATRARTADIAQQRFCTLARSETMVGSSAPGEEPAVAGAWWRPSARATARHWQAPR